MRKIRLSKTKAGKFNESGQLLSFYLSSIICSFYIFRDDGYFQSLSFFWNDYPHVGISLFNKNLFYHANELLVTFIPRTLFPKGQERRQKHKDHLCHSQLIYLLSYLLFESYKNWSYSFNY